MLSKIKSQINLQIKRQRGSFFLRWSKEKIAFLDLLFSFDNHQESFTAFVEHLADRIKVSERTAQRWLKEFRELGIYRRDLPSELRGEGCRFYIDPWFHKTGVRKELSALFETFAKYSKRFIYSLACLVTPISLSLNNIILEKKSDYITRAQAHARGSVSRNALNTQATHCLTHKKGKLVISDPTLKAIEEINQILPLTTHGIVKLSVHSAASLQFATKVAHIALSKYDPFAYVANLCHEFDSKTNFKPDWEAYHLRREALGIAKEDREFLDYQRLPQVQSEASRETPTASPSVKKTHKREVRSSSPIWKESYKHMETEERIAEVDKITKQLDLKKEEIPPKNSAAFFAHILAFGSLK